MAYLNKDNLVKYVISKHRKLKRHDISPIKLQKTLYFLYAMWAGNASIINNDIAESNEGICEYEEKLDIDLFEPCFEAWKYGPVDREIYYSFKQGEYEKCSLDNVELSFNGAEGMEVTLGSFVDSIIEQTFEISDFSLIDMSHLDKSWSKAFEFDPTETTVMDKKEIIDEYTERLKKY